jgi:DNA repair photolyase
VGKFGPSPWGTWVIPKDNLIEVLADELRKPQARQYRVFMASATDPYQPLEARALLSRQCLDLFHTFSINWLVIQTRSLLVQRDFDLLARLPFATLNVSIETDLPDVYRRFTRSLASPDRRLALVRQALALGIATQITVAPMLPASPDFAARLAHALGAHGRVIVDTLVDGDGASGKRSARLGMDHWLTEAGYPGWFEQCRVQAQNLLHNLQALLGPARVLWSAAGFCDRHVQAAAP